VCPRLPRRPAVLLANRRRSRYTPRRSPVDPSARGSLPPTSAAYQPRQLPLRFPPITSSDTSALPAAHRRPARRRQRLPQSSQRHHPKGLVKPDSCSPAGATAPAPARRLRFRHRHHRCRNGSATSARPSRVCHHAKAQRAVRRRQQHEIERPPTRRDTGPAGVKGTSDAASYMPTFPPVEARPGRASARSPTSVPM